VITHVAIRFQGKVWSLPPPNRHHDVIRLIVKETGVKYVDARDDDQGFLIDGETYCRRNPALAHALKHEQCVVRVRALSWLEIGLFVLAWSVAKLAAASAAGALVQATTGRPIDGLIAGPGLSPCLDTGRACGDQAR
jgi:hypothetical protein